MCRAILVFPLRRLDTPGHTAGTVCLFSEKRRLLVSGDALQFHAGVLEGPARSVTQDYDVAIRSLQAIAGLDFDVIAFSHFPPILENGSGRVRRLLSRIAA